MDIQSIFQIEINGLTEMLGVAISIRYIDFGQGIRLSASPFLRRITDPVPILSGVWFWSVWTFALIWRIFWSAFSNSFSFPLSIHFSNFFSKKLAACRVKWQPRNRPSSSYNLYADAISDFLRLFKIYRLKIRTIMLGYVTFHPSESLVNSEDTRGGRTSIHGYFSQLFNYLSVIEYENVRSLCRNY